MERRQQIRLWGHTWALGVRALSYSLGYEMVSSTDEARSGEKF